MLLQTCPYIQNMLIKGTTLKNVSQLYSGAIILNIRIKAEY